MKVEMSKTKRILCLIAIFLTSIGVMHDLVLIPVISNLYGAFPEQMPLVNYIISGPMLILIAASLLATALIKKLNKKTVIIIGGILFSVGAILGAVIENALYMAAMRTLVGIGAAFVNVVGIALIADIYEDENMRAKIMGYYNAALTFTAIFFSYFSGLIAESSKWQNSFLLYWTAIPMLVTLFLFIPSIKAEKEDAESKSEKDVAEEPMGWQYWAMSVSWFVMNVLFGATVLYFVAPYIVENNLGGPTFVGLATSIKQIVGFVSMLVFGFIYAKLKNNTNLVCCLVAAASLFYLIYAPSAFSAIVIVTIAGTMYKIAFAYVYAKGFEIVPKSRVDDAVAITTAVYGFGSFLSTYFATWLLQVMNKEMFTDTWVVPAVLFIVLAAAEIVISRKQKDESVAGVA